MSIYVKTSSGVAPLADPICYIKRVKRDNLVCNTNDYDYFSFEAPKKEGYSRSVINVNIQNATTNGYGMSRVHYIGYRTVDQTYIAIDLRNYNTANTTRLWISIDVLYFRDVYTQGW